MNPPILNFRLIHIVLIGLSLSFLSACAGDQRLRVCPRVGVLYDASRLTLFGSSGEQTEQNVAFDAEIANVKVRCDYDKNTVKSDIDFDLEILAGPVATPGKQTFRYFVAVTELNQRSK